jgi:hypothetical protein
MNRRNSPQMPAGQAIFVRLAFNFQHQSFKMLLKNNRLSIFWLWFPYWLTALLNRLAASMDVHNCRRWNRAVIALCQARINLVVTGFRGSRLFRPGFRPGCARGRHRPRPRRADRSPPSSRETIPAVAEAVGDIGELLRGPDVVARGERQVGQRVQFVGIEAGGDQQQLRDRTVQAAG